MSITNQPIRYDGDITEAGLAAFAEKFFKKELTPTLKSEEPSDEDLEQPVKVLKGKSFSKLVLENGERFFFVGTLCVCEKTRKEEIDSLFTPDPGLRESAGCCY